MIPVKFIEVGIVIDISFLIYYFLVRKVKVRKEEANVNLRGLGYYLLFSSFFILFIVSAFAQIPSLLVWWESVAFSAFLFLLGVKVIQNG
jgi:hypothetical protein